MDPESEAQRGGRSALVMVVLLALAGVAGFSMFRQHMERAAAVAQVEEALLQAFRAAPWEEDLGQERQAAWDAVVALRGEGAGALEASLAAQVRDGLTAGTETELQEVRSLLIRWREEATPGIARQLGEGVLGRVEAEIERAPVEVEVLGEAEDGAKRTPAVAGE